MSISDKSSHCPHCGEKLRAFELPEACGWDEEYHLACFNDDCPYYRDGWKWMWEQYQVRVSYRYRVDPKSGKDSPLAVWSETAIKDRIINEDKKP